MSIRVLAAGLGNMGRSHALAYHHHLGFDLVGLVNRSAPRDLPGALAGYRLDTSFPDALRALQPDLVSINTYTDTHADYAVMALEQGAHVFIEKPLAATVADAERVVAAAKANNRKLIVGYILRHHPSWVRLIEEARALGGPYVFRMNLNQQSSGIGWSIHKQLMQTTSPIVDCGVHYVDVWCQITDAKPIEVRGMGLMIGVDIDTPELAKTLLTGLMQRHIILNRTHETVLRFLPPFLITTEHVDRTIKALDDLLTENTSASATTLAGEAVHG